VKVKIRYNRWFPKCIRLEGITLYPYIIISSSETVANKKKILKHEWIHIKQVRKEGFFKFYTKYLFEWTTNLIKYGRIGKAYRNISYEKEAYKNENKVMLPKNLN